MARVNVNAGTREVILTLSKDEAEAFARFLETHIGGADEFDKDDDAPYRIEILMQEVLE